MRCCYATLSSSAAATEKKKRTRPVYGLVLVRLEVSRDATDGRLAGAVGTHTRAHIGMRIFAKTRPGETDEKRTEKKFANNLT